MLKRIKVEQLTLGMHLKKFCGSWLDHPFFRNSFVLTDPQDIEAILASNIKEVWIDCEKGLDVVTAEETISEAESEAQLEDELKQVASGQRQAMRVPAAQEIARAAKICLRSKESVMAMFEDVRMGRLVEMGGAKLVVDEIASSIVRNPGALISLVRIKEADNYTYMHSVAVCAMMVALAKQLGWDEDRTRSAGLAGLLHDLGKAVTPPEILKKPAKLTDAEFGIMKGHSAEGYKLLLSGASNDPMVMDVCLHHHERMDGLGYPDRLQGEQISLAARMGAVCDVYDAITSNRRYKLGWDPSESLRQMAQWVNGHFDPKVFQAFVKSMGIYPVGSLVRLSSGRIGVVTEQTDRSLIMPIVKVFFSIESNMRIEPQIVDLSQPGVTEKITQREDPANWYSPEINELWSGLPQSSW